MKRITHTSSSRLDNGSVYIETDSRLPIASLISLCPMQDDERDAGLESAIDSRLLHHVPDTRNGDDGLTVGVQPSQGDAISNWSVIIASRRRSPLLPVSGPVTIDADTRRIGKVHDPLPSAHDALRPFPSAAAAQQQRCNSTQKFPLARAPTITRSSNR